MLEHGSSLLTTEQIGQQLKTKVSVRPEQPNVDRPEHSFYVPGLQLLRLIKAWEEAVRRWGEFGIEGTFEFGSGDNRDHQQRLLRIGTPYLQTENKRREAEDEPPIAYGLTRLLLRFHDVHEIITGDEGSGIKTPEFKLLEYKAVDDIIALIPDPTLRHLAEEIAPHIKNPYDSVEGRFLKAIEAIDNLTVGLDVHEAAIQGAAKNVVQPHLLVWDTFYNNVSRLLSHLPQFPSLKSWLIEHADQLQEALTITHGDVTTSEAYQQQMAQRPKSQARKYPPALEMVASVERMRRDIQRIVDEQRPEATPLHMLKSRLTPELLRAIRETQILSPEAQKVRRFSGFVGTASDGDDDMPPFPLEGDLWTHVVGSFERTDRLLQQEFIWRTYLGMNPIVGDAQYLHALILVADVHDLDLPSDLPLGTHTEIDRLEAERRFKQRVERILDLEVRTQLRQAYTFFQQCPEHELVRFKKACDHAGYVEMALRLQEWLINGKPYEKALLNPVIGRGVHIEPTLRRDRDGKIREPKIVSGEALIADLLANSGQEVVNAARSFPSIQKYLYDRRMVLATMVNSYLLDQAYSDQLFAEVAVRKGYAGNSDIELSQYLKRLESAKVLQAYFASLSERDPFSTYVDDESTLSTLHPDTEVAL